MDGSIEQLVCEVADVTGAPLPELLDAQSPALRGDAASPFYIVGLIGGKEVGKSALVNALVGQNITVSTTFGPGTENVVAYVHQQQVEGVRELLEREARGRYTIVPHAIEHLQRQVLLDLPDIDSVYDDHIELTRRMLRHMLFPIWVQSIEKYADQQPQKLLAAVAEGNDPANFVFCLNKADQIDAAALDEIRDDYAKRVARLLRRASPPQAYLASAIRPDAFDLPELKKKLSQQKPAENVKQSLALAGRQRERSMLAWVDGQRLGERVARLRRLEEEAQELLASRLITPLLEEAAPAIIDDPAHRAAIVDEVMAARVARWPVVNVLHTLLSPLTSLWRRNVGTAPTAAALVAANIDVDGRPMSAAIQATFALLQQTHPLAGPLYREQKLWEQMPADAAAAELRRGMVAALETHRADAVKRIARRGIIAPLFRWLLTIGAMLWFPIIQPVLELALQDSLSRTTRGILLLVVQLLGVTYLLKSAAFLSIWFIVLWLILRWNTQRRVAKLPLDLTTTVMTWTDELLDPIHTARQREETLATKVDEARRQITAPAA